MAFCPAASHFSLITRFYSRLATWGASAQRNLLAFERQVRFLSLRLFFAWCRRFFPAVKKNVWGGNIHRAGGVM